MVNKECWIVNWCGSSINCGYKIN